MGAKLPGPVGSSLQVSHRLSYGVSCGAVLQGFRGQGTPSPTEELHLWSEVVTPSTQGPAHVQPWSRSYADSREVLSPHPKLRATLPVSGLWNSQGEIAFLLAMTPGRFCLLSLQLVCGTAGAREALPGSSEQGLTVGQSPRRGSSDPLPWALVRDPS